MEYKNIRAIVSEFSGLVVKLSLHKLTPVRPRKPSIATAVAMTMALTSPIHPIEAHFFAMVAKDLTHSLSLKTALT
jgi:hypothetical protein